MEQQIKKIERRGIGGQDTMLLETATYPRKDKLLAPLVMDLEESNYGSGQ